MNEVKFNQRALYELLQSEEGPVAKHLLKTGLQVERAAKRYTPVRTGRLRASITTTLGRDSQGLYARVGSNVAYAIYIEFGTRYMRAYAMLRCGLREVMGR